MEAYVAVMKSQARRIVFPAEWQYDRTLAICPADLVWRLFGAGRKERSVRERVDIVDIVMTGSLCK